MQTCTTEEIYDDCLSMDLRCKAPMGCLDVECVEAYDCPPPPPVALVDCQAENVVNVIQIPLCDEMGQCGYDSDYRVIRDCSVDGQVCRDGECVPAEDP